MEMPVRSARGADRRRPGEDGDHTDATAFGDAGYQPANRALLVSCGTNCVPGEAFCGGAVANTQYPQEKIRGIHQASDSRLAFTKGNTWAEPVKREESRR